MMCTMASSLRAAVWALNWVELNMQDIRNMKGQTAARCLRQQALPCRPVATLRYGVYRDPGARRPACCESKTSATFLMPISFLRRSSDLAFSRFIAMFRSHVHIVQGAGHGRTSSCFQPTPLQRWCIAALRSRISTHGRPRRLFCQFCPNAQV